MIFTSFSDTRANYYLLASSVSHSFYLSFIVIKTSKLFMQSIIFHLSQILFTTLTILFTISNRRYHSLPCLGVEVNKGLFSSFISRLILFSSARTWTWDLISSPMVCFSSWTSFFSSFFSSASFSWQILSTSALSSL